MSNRDCEDCGAYSGADRAPAGITVTVVESGTFTATLFPNNTVRLSAMQGKQRLGPLECAWTGTDFNWADEEHHVEAWVLRYQKSINQLKRELRVATGTATADDYEQRYTERLEEWFETRMACEEGQVTDAEYEEADTALQDAFNAAILFAQQQGQRKALNLAQARRPSKGVRHAG